MLLTGLSWLSWELVLRSILTGVFLGLGFILKDHLHTWYLRKKGTVEMNMEDGHSLFFDPEIIRKKNLWGTYLSNKFGWDFTPQEIRQFRTVFSESIEGLQIPT